ncbi:MAG: flagellar assembly protein A [bacterium]
MKKLDDITYAAEVEARQAPLSSRDFSVERRIDGPEMSATVKVVCAAPECGVSEFDILCALYNEGVREGVDYEAVERMVKDKSFGLEVEVAAGFPPDKGENAEIEMKVALADFGAAGLAKAPVKGVAVKAGQIIAVKKPATAGRVGLTVSGRRLEPKSGRDARFKLGDNVTLSDDGLTLSAAIDGLAGLENDKISVKDPDFALWKESIAISDDKMEAVLTIIPGQSKQPEYSEKWFEGQIKKSGIKFGLEKDAFKKIPKRIDKPVTIAVARGERPTRGRDARIEERVRGKAAEWLLPSAIAKGQLIAERIPAQEGAPGRNVFDERIPAAYTSFVKMAAGPGALMSEDGTKIFAGKEGCVRREKNTFSVVKCAEVDFSKAGSERRINYEGAVRVTGGVPKGCSIVAGHHVLVEGDICESEVVAGGELLINGAVADCLKTKIQSGGDMYLRSAARSRVWSGGNVYAEGALVNCELIADGGIFKSGDNKLTVAGGCLIAGGGAKVDGLSASAGSPAKIVAGAPHHLRVRFEHSVRELSSLNEKLQMVASEIARLEKAAVARRISVEDAARLRKLKIARNMFSEKVNLGRSGVRKLQAELAAFSRGAKVIISETAAAGTAVTIGPATHKFNTAAMRISVSLDDAGTGLIVSKL